MDWEERRRKLDNKEHPISKLGAKDLDLSPIKSPRTEPQIRSFELCLLLSINTKLAPLPSLPSARLLTPPLP